MRTNETLWDVIHAGDWASAHGDHETLGAIAGDLARILSGELRGQAAEIVRLAEEEPEEASRRWAELATALRTATESRLPL